MIRQILYASRAATSHRPAPIDAILEQSRHNNALDGVTGLLFADGTRYLQVLEGPDASVLETFARIGRDQRHTHLILLLDRQVAEREFGFWTMADGRRGESLAGSDTRLRLLMADASPAVRDAFLDLIDYRAAA